MATATQTQTVSTTQVPVRFTTKTRYALPPQRFMVPTAWRRRELSQLINKSLDLPSPVPFDFLAAGTLLRASLEEWIEKSGFGTEETIELEYVESLLPPRQAAHIPHDDWVSAVSCDIQGHFLTATYDGQLRVFDSSQQPVCDVRLHDAPVTSIHRVPLNNASPLILAAGTNNVDLQSHVFASSSYDGTALLSLLSISSSGSSPTSGQVQPIASLHAHNGPISSAASSSSGSHILTGGWDTHLALWDTHLPSSDEVSEDGDASSAQRRKRRKVDKGQSDGTVGNRKGGKGQLVRKAPLALLRGHTGRVTGSIFAQEDANVAYSCAYDGTVRAWSVERQLQVGSLTAPDRPFLSLIRLHNSSPSLLACSSADRSISVYDTRTFSSPTSSNAPIALLHPSSSAVALPSALAASPTQPNHLASGSSDGAVRIWDIRAPGTALASFRAGTSDNTDNAKAKLEKKESGDSKVLALAWARGLLAAGGESGLDVWRVAEPSTS